MSARPQSNVTAFPEADHDHERCVDRAIAKGVALCARRGARLTALRRRVLEIVWQSHRPLGAYDILDILRGEGRSSAPPSVYRALDFLLENGLVHRISTSNAFLGCSEPGHHASCQFLICEICGTALEVHDRALETALEHAGAGRGFRARRHTVEITGRCPDCA